MGKFAFPAGHDLPGVAGDTRRPADGLDLGSRRKPAHIPHIRAAGAEGRGGIERRNEVVNRLFSVPGKPPERLFNLGIPDAVDAGNAASGIACFQGGGQTPILLCISRHADLLQVPIQGILDAEVRKKLRRAVDEDTFKIRPRHQRGAPGNVVHPGLKLHGVRHLIRPDHIKDRRVGLHHVRRDPAGIRDGIMDPAVVGHVLPQKLHPDIHEFHRIQRASPVIGVSGGMGRLAPEAIEHLDAGIVCSGFDLVDIARVPAQGGVQLFPQAVPGHESFSRSPLFSRAAEKDHRTGPAAFLQPLLDGAGRGEGAHAKQIVPAAVTVPAGDKGLCLGASGFLAEAREGVKFSQNADHRSAAAEAAAEGRFDPAEFFRHLKA